MWRGGGEKEDGWEREGNGGGRRERVRGGCGVVKLVKPKKGEKLRCFSL